MFYCYFCCKTKGLDASQANNSSPPRCHPLFTPFKFYPCDGSSTKLYRFFRSFFFHRLGDYLSVTCRWRIWKNRMHPQWWRVKDSFLPRYKSTWKGLRRISEIFYFHLYPWLSSCHQVVTFPPFFFLSLYCFFLKVFYHYFFRGS